MGTQILAVSSVRMFRYAFGSLLAVGGHGIAGGQRAGLAGPGAQDVARTARRRNVCAGYGAGGGAGIGDPQMPVSGQRYVAGLWCWGDAGGDGVFAGRAGHYGRRKPGAVSLGASGLVSCGYHAGCLFSVSGGPQGLRCQPGDAGQYARRAGDCRRASGCL
jgi:hypothetical protein